jgi:Tfp pilus assembly protein PilF
MRAGTLGSIALVAALALGCATTSVEEREQQGKQARAHYDLGVDHLIQGRTELALRELLAAERLAPKDPWIQLWMAEAYRRKERFALAEQHIQRAIEIEKDFHEAHLNLSALYIQLERYEEAVAHAERLWNDPTFPAPWRALTNLGWAELRLGRAEESRTHLTLAIELNERYWPAILNLGVLEGEQGQRIEALRRFQQVLELTPPQTVRDEVHFRMAEVYVSLGRRERALAHFRASAAGNARARWAQESQRYLQRLR